MSGEAFVLGLLALVTVLAAVVLWSIFATARTRVSADEQRACRDVAEQAVRAQQATAASLAELTAGLEAVEVRLETLERSRQSPGR